jgi:hypothetical protein
MKQLYISLLSLLFLFACKPQKSIQEYKYITKTDTLVRTQINTIYQSVNDTTYIENPCDSIGILNQFYAKISIPFGKVIIKGKNNRIVLSVKTDSLSSTMDNTYKSKDSKVISIKEKEIIKYRIPTWAVALMFIETAIIVLYLWFKLN